MADVKISALPAATTPLAGTEVLPIVQSGTTDKVSVANLTAGRDVSTNSIAVASGVPVYLNGTSGNTQILYYAGLVIDMQVNGTKGFRVYAPGAGTSELRGDWSVNNTGGGSGNLTMSNGNIVQGTAAKGVNFTANTGAAGKTSQLLNWYEEGTWTPTYTPASGAFGSITYNTNTYGRYTRIGNVVVVLGIVVTDVFTIGTAAGLIWIDGLPFTPATSASAAINYSANFTTNNPSGGYTSGNRIYPTYRTTANGGSTGIQAGDLANGSFGNYIIFQATYVV